MVACFLLHFSKSSTVLTSLIMYVGFLHSMDDIQCVMILLDNLPSFMIECLFQFSLIISFYTNLAASTSSCKTSNLSNPSVVHLPYLHVPYYDFLVYSLKLVSFFSFLADFFVINWGVVVPG